MRKVLVLGCAGSGKSTFSKSLGAMLDLPVIHLDALYWKPGWVASTESEWDGVISELIKKEAYILDGNYTRTIGQRLDEADTIYYFDIPRFICLYRIIKRRIMYQGKTREDMAEGCKEKIDMDFLRWVWNYKKKKRPKILKILEAVNEEKEVIIFTSSSEVKKYFKDVYVEGNLNE